MTSILTSILAFAVISGGSVVGFSKAPGPFTFNEVRTLMDVYNTQLKLNPLTLVNPPKGAAFLSLINAKLSKTFPTAPTIGGTALSSSNYKLLATGLMKKAELNLK